MTITAEPDLTYKKAMTRLRGKLTLADIRFAVMQAREALSNTIQRDGQPPLAVRHSMDEDGCGWWTETRYRRNCVARFIVQRKGVRLM